MRAAGVLLSRTMRHSYSAKLPELLEARPRIRFNDRFRVALRTARLRNVGGTERPIAEQFKFIDERLKNLHHWLSRIRRARSCKRDQLPRLRTYCCAAANGRNGP